MEKNAYHPFKTPNKSTLRHNINQHAKQTLNLSKTAKNYCKIKYNGGWTLTHRKDSPVDEFKKGLKSDQVLRLS